MGNLLGRKENENVVTISDINEARAFAKERLWETQNKLGLFDERSYSSPAREFYSILEDVLFDLQFTHLDIEYGDIHSLNKKTIPFLEKLLARLEKIQSLNRWESFIMNHNKPVCQQVVLVFPLLNKK